MARRNNEEKPDAEADAVPRAGWDRIKRLVKWFLGLLLLPGCWAVTISLIHLLAPLGSGGVAGVPVSAWWFLGGFLFWIVLFCCLPLPVRGYVLAHELTHALWASLVFGVKVKGIRVSDAGGHVALTRVNTWITLAPYFFPLYTILAILAYVVINAFADATPYEPFWMAVVGLTWSFHVTFTLRTLRTRQTDILANGRLFSYVFIYLLNLLGLALFVVAVTDATFVGLLDRLVEDANRVYGAIWTWATDTLGRNA